LERPSPIFASVLLSYLFASIGFKPADVLKRMRFLFTLLWTLLNAVSSLFCCIIHPHRHQSSSCSKTRHPVVFLLFTFYSLRFRHLIAFLKSPLLSHYIRLQIPFLPTRLFLLHNILPYRYPIIKLINSCQSYPSAPFAKAFDVVADEPTHPRPYSSFLDFLIFAFMSFVSSFWFLQSEKFGSLIDLSLLVCFNRSVLFCTGSISPVLISLVLLLSPI